MKIYLSGVLIGNNGYIYKNMEIYLVSFKRLIDGNKNIKNDMNLYLAGEHPQKNGKDLLKIKNYLDIYILESFYYLQKNDWMKSLIKRKPFKGFILDSGAFSFMTGAGGKVDWIKYIDKYSNFIKEYDIDLFFELDIDSVIGLKKVEELRKRLEDKTGKKSIPVWHRSRGKDYFIKTCQKYDYVAIGGIVTKEIKRNEHRIFPWFIETAHKYGAKIHSLGYTNLKGLEKYKFDSVDSTAWLYGNIGGYIYNFTGKTLKQIECSKNMRLKGEKVALHNFQEWVKFQRYAEKNL